MSVHFLANELARWDALVGEENGKAPLPQALALGVFTDERPLRGAAGLADWRLAGRLSRLLKKERLAGRADEVMMLPPARGRLPFARIVVFGLGDQASFDERRFARAASRMREVLFRAGVHRYAVQPPGRSTGLIAPRRALELWLEQAKTDGFDAEVTIIESPAATKEMQEALRGRRAP
jgi:hypothetical protein